MPTRCGWRRRFPAIVSRAQFHRVGRQLSSRAPKFSHPRRVGSSYLLSGLVKCKTCKDAAHRPVRPERASTPYYVCQSNFKLGKDSCKTPTLIARRFDELVVAKIRSNILTEGNTRDLVKVVDEEDGRRGQRTAQAAGDHRG